MLGAKDTGHSSFIQSRELLVAHLIDGAAAFERARSVR